MILNILEELAADNSKLAKIAILKREYNNELLKKVIVAALNPYVTYYIKKIPVITEKLKIQSLEWAIEQLDELSARLVTGQTGVDHLTFVLSSLSEDDHEVISRIIERDLKCGVDTSPNKVWEGLIPTFDVMLSHKDCSGIKYPAYAQTKMDGARAHVHFSGGKATAWSRSGKEYQLLNMLYQSSVVLMDDGETWDGELLFTDENGKILDRKTSNGLANKAIKGTLSQEEATRVIFVSWDIVDFSGTVPYETRWSDLKTRLDRAVNLGIANQFRLVQSKLVNNEDEALSFYEEQIINGEEGSIEKNLAAVWQPKRTKDLGKRKAEEDCDLVIVGYKPGTGKYEGQVGSLECETSDGLLRVFVSGMNEEVRFNPPKIGDIITVKYNAIIDKKTGGQKSLFLPRFVCVREDKSVANSVGELK